MPELVPIKSRKIRILKGNTKSKTDSSLSNNSNKVKKPEVAKEKNDRNENFEVVTAKNGQDNSFQIITRENVQEYLLKDLMEQERALDEEAPLAKILERNKETLDHDYVMNSLGHDYTGNIITNIKEEPRDGHSDDSLNFVTKEDMDQESLNQNNEDIIMKQETEDDVDNVRIKTEPLDNIILYPDYNMANIEVNDAVVENDLLKVFQVSRDIANVFQASTSVNGEVRATIKEEPMDELDYEDDIIVLNNDNFTIEEHPLFKTDDEEQLETNSREIKEDMSKFEPEIIVTKKSPCKEHQIRLVRNKKENIFKAEIKIVSNRSFQKTNDDFESDSKNMKKKKKTRRIRRGAKRYKCKKCNYEGFFREFRKHLVQCRPTQKFTKITNEDENKLTEESLWDQYYCTKCNCIFFTLKKYIMHFVSHNVKQGSCPVCAMKYPTITRLGLHFINHVKESYVKDEQATDENMQMKKQNEQLVAQYSNLIKKNEVAIKYNENFIKTNEKYINDNEKYMKDEHSMDNERLLERNEKLLTVNEELVSTNVELKNRNDKLKLKIAESNITGVSYECKTCNEKMLLRDTFQHFEQHLLVTPEPSKCKTEANDEERDQNNQVNQSSIISPESIKEIIGKL